MGWSAVDRTIQSRGFAVCEVLVPADPFILSDHKRQSLGLPLLMPVFGTISSYSVDDQEYTNA